MNSRTIKWAGLLSSLLFIFVVGTFFFSGCSQDPTLVSPSTTQPGLEVSRWISEEILATTAVQNRHTDRLLELEGVVGTATGLTPDGRPAIKILTARPEVAGIPRDLEGVPVIVEVTGEIIAHLGGKDRWPRPVPTGVSVGNINECSAGTIGCGLVIGSGRYLLSNNHVIARQNNAAIGEDIVQPGTYDNKPKCTKKSQDQIGDLADFERIVFASNANNVMDAAIAVSSTANL